MCCPKLLLGICFTQKLWCNLAKMAKEEWCRKFHSHLIFHGFVTKITLLVNELSCLLHVYKHLGLKKNKLHWTQQGQKLMLKNTPENNELLAKKSKSNKVFVPFSPIQLVSCRSICNSILFLLSSTYPPRHVVKNSWPIRKFDLWLRLHKQYFSHRIHEYLHCSK